MVTGSNGLIGSECVQHFDDLGWEVVGVDNNMRRQFFGPDGDTLWNLERLRAATRNFRHCDSDIRDRDFIDRLLGEVRPDLVIHAAAQPSHDLAARIPVDDFEVNANGTLNLLEATRQHAPEAVFVFMSTNKVYGDAPNSLPLEELETRWDFADERRGVGIDERMSIDQSMHSLFGVSKVAADVMTQEYGHYFGMKTVCLRGGCLTGPAHSGAQLHGFLSYLVKCAMRGDKYTVFGYKGKQVRDNIHSYDVCRAIEVFAANPRPGEVYNIGGGPGNSVSILEVIARIEELSGRRLDWEYSDKARSGDHICYYTDLGKFRRDYPEWDITKSLDDILKEEIAQVEKSLG
ncbi:NAD-dependent epimerase/dehydratase family protein [bacterium]|nr:NAD-dependent epimerase/dehydratase family protein [bacterium]